MKKFTQKINESSEFDENQLAIGIKVETEHGDIYHELVSYLGVMGIVMPWSEKEFYEKIAKAHLKEMPDYYTRLDMVEDGEMTCSTCECVPCECNDKD